MILHQQLLNFVVKTYLMQLNMFLACHLSKEFFQKIWSPIFKKDEKFFFTNYRLIPVLPRFSKLLEKIMYNRLYRYLSENNYLYEKHFGFQAAHSTEHAVIQTFNENEHTIGIFIDLRHLTLQIIIYSYKN